MTRPRSTLIALVAALSVLGAQACGDSTAPAAGSGGSGAAGGAGAGGASGGFGGSAGCVAELDVGLDSACAVETNGSVWCWGRNDAGSWDAGLADQPTPTEVTGFGDRIASVAVGAGHACALDAGGSLWCWGTNGHGQLGNGTTDPSAVPVRVDALGTTVQAVAAGAGDSCAIVHDGTLRCWGSNTWGTLGDGTTTDRSLPVEVQGLPAQVVQVSTYGATCAALADGTVWCWGVNLYGSLGVPVTDHGPYDGDDFTRLPARVGSLDGVVQVEAGGTNNCALEDDGTVWAWGQDGLGRPRPPVGSTTPLQVTALAGAVQVTAKASHACALKKDRTLWCWGQNDYGQVGTGTKTGDQDTPVRVTALGAHVVAVGAGAFHTCALTDDGTLWCWGRNDHGQLGNGTFTDSPPPVKVKLVCP